MKLRFPETSMIIGGEIKQIDRIREYFWHGILANKHRSGGLWACLHAKDDVSTAARYSLDVCMPDELLNLEDSPVWAAFRPIPTPCRPPAKCRNWPAR